MILHEIKTTQIDGWIAQHHYLGNTPAGAVLRLAFYDGGEDGMERMIGAMMWGRNPSPKQNQQEVLCLTRMCFVDDTEHCVESRALAAARKYIRKHYPHIKGLVAYSSTGQGHEGTVYKADGWFEVSRTREGSRDCREKRKNTDTSSKIKWARSP